MKVQEMITELTTNPAFDEFAARLMGKSLADAAARRIEELEDEAVLRRYRGRELHLNMRDSHRVLLASLRRAIRERA